MEKIRTPHLKSFRESKGISILAVSELSQLSRNTLSKLEAGYPVRRATVFKLISKLAVEFGQEAAAIVDEGDLPEDYFAVPKKSEDDDVERIANTIIRSVQSLNQRDDATLGKLSSASHTAIQNAVKILQYRFNNASREDNVGYV